MINIQPFIDKLELLKEYMNLVIDDHRRQFKVNIGALPHLYPDDVLKMFFETGYLYFRSDCNPEPTLTLVSFEEFYKYRSAT